LAKGTTRGRPEAGINAAARVLGIERTEAQRAVKIASLSPEAKDKARELNLDNNQTALLRAVKMASPADQVRVLQEHVAHPDAPRSLPARDPLNDPKSPEEQMRRLRTAWSGACPEVRERFRAEIDIPAADKPAIHTA
jgi:ParB family chromosome partitioning protein